MFNDSIYGDFLFPLQHTFVDVHADTWLTDEKTWNNVDNFLADWKASPIYSLQGSWTEGSPAVTKYLITDDEVKLIYWLLYSRYGNSTIASTDETRFKINLFTLMFQYAPAWLKRLEVQKSIRGLDLENDLRSGDESFVNNALNPQNSPSNNVREALPYINSQTVQTSKKSKIRALAEVWNALAMDVTEEFINKFKGLFIQVVTPNGPLLFEEN